MPQWCVQAWVNREGSESEWSDQWSQAIKAKANIKMGDHLASTTFFSLAENIGKLDKFASSIGLLKISHSLASWSKLHKHKNKAI